MSSAVKILPHYTYVEYEQWEGQWELIEGIPYAMSPLPSFPIHFLWAIAKHLSISKKFGNTRLHDGRKLFNGSSFSRYAWLSTRMAAHRCRGSR
jgi:hypothetical protein